MNQIDFDLTATLDRVSEWQGSDLHLKHGSPPLVRVHGDLVPLQDVRRLTPADTERALWQMLEDPSRVAEFENEHEVDFSYAHTGASPTRFRVNAFRQLGGITLVCRAIPDHIRSVKELSRSLPARSAASCSSREPRAPARPPRSPRWSTRSTPSARATSSRSRTRSSSSTATVAP